MQSLRVIPNPLHCRPQLNWIDELPTMLLVGPAVEKTMTASWQVWALLSAIFAAFTAIFAKIGVENVNSDFATFIRTIVILVVLAGILFSLGEFQPLGTISGRAYIFLVLSGLATGASGVHPRRHCDALALRLIELDPAGYDVRCMQ